MNSIQNYQLRNNQTINFKGYDIKVIQESLKRGQIPAEKVVAEMRADCDKLIKSSNFEDMMKSADLSLALREISKLKLLGLKAECELKINFQKMFLATEKSPAKRAEYESIIAHCQDQIKKIEETLKI